MHFAGKFHRCADCGSTEFLTPSHTISRKEANEYGQQYLIWTEHNIECQCQDCHRRWENGDNTLPTWERRMKYIMEVAKMQWSAKDGQELKARWIYKIQDPEIRDKWIKDYL